MSVLNFKRLSTANILSLSFGSIVCADPKIVTGPVRLRFIGLKRKIFRKKGKEWSKSRYKLDLASIYIYAYIREGIYFSVTKVGLINLRAFTPHTEFATLVLIKIASLNETHNFPWFGVNIDELSSLFPA